MSTTEQETDDLFVMVKWQYGYRLTDKQLEEVHKGVGRLVELAHTLRSFPLANGVEPWSVFTPYRTPEA